ncbi:MAG TPA: hypothetical protein PLV32_13500, partial [Chitinophagaceae bacterium]|nr:hypothetical protein [Chitinophagaceae bacterium]
MEQQEKRATGWKRAGRIVLKTFLWIFFLIVLVFLLVLTPPVQNFIRKKAVTYLENKLATRVEVGRVYVGLPRDIVLEKIYVEDRKKDTLLYGGKLMADLNIWKLITKGEVILKYISLNDITAKVKRELPDTSFNFQFIIDAFAPPGSSPDTSTSSSSAIKLGTIELNKIRLLYKDVVTGNDMEASLDHLYTQVDNFDPAQMIYDVPKTNISGLVARVYQSKPMATAEPESKDSMEALEPSPIQIRFKTLQLEKIDLDYRNDVSSFYTRLDLGSLLVASNAIDLNKRVINLDEVVLKNTVASIRIGKTGSAKIVEKEVEQEVEAQAEAGWRIFANNLDLENNDLRFDNDNNQRVSKGMDYAHLHARDFTLSAKNVLLDT